MKNWERRCEDLARFFLNSEAGVTEEEVRDLAEKLQKTAERFLEDRDG